MTRKIPKSAANSIHGKFYSTISASTRFRAEDPKEPFSDRPKGYRAGRSVREDYVINVADAHELAHRNPERAARDLAYWKTRNQRNLKPGQPGPAIAELNEEIQRPRVSKTDTTLIARAQRESNWRSTPGVYKTPAKERRSTGGFIREEVAPSHKQWIEGQLKNPNSEFNQGLDLTKAKTGRYTPAQRRRLSTYTDALQEGASHQEALGRVRDSRLKTGVGRPTAQRTVGTRTSQARAVMSTRPAGRPTRLSSTQPREGELSFGIDSAARPTVDAIKQRYSNMTEQEAIRVQQAGTEFLSQQLLANQKWAHETRRANLLGQKSGKIKENPDRVTIFTTNLGHPTVSIPSDSLVGQYIIGKRKSVLRGHGVSRTQLRGQFPEAVRDAHVVDVATGVSAGLQGRQGVFNTSGYRFGKRASPGYGRPRPLGASIIYDSSGRPMYDSQGNIRYSEGATRPVDYTTPNVGFRVLIG